MLGLLADYFATAWVEERTGTSAYSLHRIQLPIDIEIYLTALSLCHRSNESLSNYSQLCVMSYQQRLWIV